MTIIKCSKCGKEFEAPDSALGNWFIKNPDKAKCTDCYGNSKTNKSSSATGSRTVNSSSSFAKRDTSTKSQKQEVNAEMFKRAYDELLAEFADVKDDVAPYLGGWVSTIVINRSR